MGCQIQRLASHNEKCTPQNRVKPTRDGVLRLNVLGVLGTDTVNSVCTFVLIDIPLEGIVIARKLHKFPE